MNKPPLANQDHAMHIQQWQNEVNSLCFDLFYNTEAGKRLLWLWEQRYFFAPTADPNQSVAYARFNEGRNNFIRGIRAAAHQAMVPKEATQVKQDIEHERQNDE